jgi:hypothetical protein
MSRKKQTQNVTGVSFLCGRVTQIMKGVLEPGTMQVATNDACQVVSENDPGLSSIKKNKSQFIVFRNQHIWAVYNRPRMKLLFLLARDDSLITEEILQLYTPADQYSFR